MPPRRELQAFAAVLAALLAGFFSESLFGGKVLSPADVLLASVTFGGQSGPGHEPSNRLLIDPVLQFQPWLEFNRAMLRRGRLPLWNDLAGCGAPHLANGQSAVFDPFHAIAYLGRLPDAYAWMAAARLWVAGLGMFLLARSWRFGGWGRWFAGLTWPFCGFLVVWLLYPVTSAAIWMPWLLLASERLLVRPSVRSASALALCVGLVLLGGHIQTGAHVLLAAGVYALWRWQPGRMRSRWEGEAPAEPRLAPEARQEPRPSGSPPESGREAGHWVSPQMPRGALAGWAGGVLLGVVIGAIAVVPLGFYLARSPVWADRSEARRPAWQLGRPRLLDAVCTAFPYAFGSQRRGHPNLARALGVHNLNESAGGFAGLATLIWLAHAAWSARRSQPRVRFLVGLAGFGAMAAFGLPPVDNLLRALPVLNVTDNRRLTLWLAFGLVMLGGVGIDHLDTVRLRRGWKP
ncbi:MAG TPA: hypothetical protein VGZ22_30965, partial [Isosphaeraceae bacterium]|nr:hypothetical protein [Isosphaeraceae bacterium]